MSINKRKVIKFNVKSEFEGKWKKTAFKFVLSIGREY